MKNTEKKRGFTLVEILVVVLILSILTTFVIVLIAKYVNTGKEKYDTALDSQFLLSGKNYFADNQNKLPTVEGERYGNYVTLAELINQGLVSKDFINSSSKECDLGSRVYVYKENGTYHFNTCLLCDTKEENDITNCEPDPLPEDSYSCVEANGNYYDKSGNVVGELEYFSSCPDKKKKCTKATDGKYYTYEGKEVSKDSDEYKTSCGCRTITDSDGVNTSYLDKNGLPIESSKHVNECGCQNIGSRYYDKGGKEVLKTTHDTSCSCQTVGDRYYDKKGNKVTKTTYDASCSKPVCDKNKCNPITPFKNITKSNYYYVINGDKKYTTIAQVEENVKGKTNGTVTLQNSEDVKYGHYISKSAMNAIVKIENANKLEPQVTNGNIGTINDNYYKKSVRKNATSLNKYEGAKKDSNIPSEYSFKLGGSAELVHFTKLESSKRMSLKQIKEWKSASEAKELYNKAYPVLNKSGVVGNYSVYYENIGEYQKKKIDVKMTLTGLSNCNSKKTCGFYFGLDNPYIRSFGMRRITVKYEFYDHDSNATWSKRTKTTVKGYTTYWDIDGKQGIHLLKGSVKIYTSSNSNLYVKKINDAPYVFTKHDGNYHEYEDKAVFTETFYGSTITRVFTFNVHGVIKHSKIPIGARLSYKGTTYTNESILGTDDAVTYIIHFSNTHDQKENLNVSINMSNMQYISGSAQLHYSGNDVSSNASFKNGVLTVTKSNVKQRTTGYLIFKAKPTSNLCGELSKISASVKIGSTTYKTNELSNAVMCPEKYKCTNNC